MANIPWGSWGAALMGWLRLCITTGGQSERKFADDALRPHLAAFSIDVKTRVVLTNRKLGKRGGILDFDRIHGDLLRLKREDSHPEARITIMVDLYALRARCPHFNEWVGRLERLRAEIL